MPNLVLYAKAYGRSRTGREVHRSLYMHLPSYDGKAVLIDLRPLYQAMMRVDVLSVSVVYPVGWGLRSAVDEADDQLVSTYPGNREAANRSESLVLVAEPRRGWFES